MDKESEMRRELEVVAIWQRITEVAELCERQISLAMIEEAKSDAIEMAIVTLDETGDIKLAEKRAIDHIKYYSRRISRAKRRERIVYGKVAEDLAAYWDDSDEGTEWLYAHFTREDVKHILMRLNGCKPSEVASELGIEPGVERIRWHRTRRRLEQMLAC